MAKFISLTSVQDKKSIAVNLDQVTKIRDTGKAKVRFFFSDGRRSDFIGNYKDLLNRLPQ